MGLACNEFYKKYLIRKKYFEKVLTSIKIYDTMCIN